MLRNILSDYFVLMLRCCHIENLSLFERSVSGLFFFVLYRWFIGRLLTYSIVLAYMPDEKTAGRYGDDTLYPDGLETVPKRFAISKRNEWMVRHSDYMICYVYKITGSAVKVREMAQKRGVKVVDLLLIS